MKTKYVTNEIDGAIRRGIEFLQKDQQKDGSFMCLVSAVFDNYSKADVVPAIVPSNIVLSSLAHIKETPPIKKIRNQTARFLLTQRGEHWSFNYWFKGTREYTEIPYPDDLDDTFCALAALYEYDPDLFQGDVMGKIITMLTAAEDAPGGPYDMWLVAASAREKWRDIDLVVNSNVSFFLHLNDIHLPKLSAFIEKSIDENEYEFPYNTIYPGIYFISRFYEGTKTADMVKLLLSKKEKEGRWENPLRTALAVSSLLNFSKGKLWPEVKDSIDYIVRSQEDAGFWPPAAFFFQMRLTEKTLYAGSASITTALCIEALDKFQKAKEQFPDKLALKSEDTAQDKKTEQVQQNDQTKNSANEVYRRVRERFDQLQPDFKKQALRVLVERQRKDVNCQIALTAYFFREAIGSTGKNIDEDFVIKLGVANVYGWTAYDIYDDFLDGEGDPALLSVANLCLRESYGIMQLILPPEIGFADFSRIVFDLIDAANTWEVVNCHHIDMRSKKILLPQYGNYSQLAEKSIGHALGPVAILFKLGYEKNSAEVRTVMEFFRHYLIARQLNDDAHDWREDFENGYINAVACRILSDMGVENKNREIEKMEQQFWNKTVIPVCGDILKAINLARGILKENPLIENHEILMNLLVSVEQAALKALDEQKETKKFLRVYGR